MPSKCIVNPRNAVSIEISSLRMPSQSGTRTKVRAEEPEATTQPIVHAEWIEENKENERVEPWSKKAKSIRH